MTRGAIRLGRIFGIDVSANIGVLGIGALLTWSLAVSILPDGAPGLVSMAYWAVAFLGALCFLGSLLLHELAHSVVARRNQVEVDGITLWLFGGVSQFRTDPATPGADFRITAAGPGTSLLLGAAFFGLSEALSAVGGPAVHVVMLEWLALINIVLAVFNLLPGAPLDGGRLVAAALWKLRGDRTAGRIGAAKAGRVVGAGLMALGGVEIYLLGGGSGLWTVLIGWFLFNAARSELTHYQQERDLERHAAAAATDSLAAASAASAISAAVPPGPPPAPVAPIQHWEPPVPSQH